MRKGCALIRFVGESSLVVAQGVAALGNQEYQVEEGCADEDSDHRGRSCCAWELGSLPVRSNYALDACILSEARLAADLERGS